MRLLTVTAALSALCLGAALAATVSKEAAAAGASSPYAVSMEPMVPYSQRDPLYHSRPGRSLSHHHARGPHAAASARAAAAANLRGAKNRREATYGAPPPPAYDEYGPPAAQHHEYPEPIIEIIIKESNESLPAPPPPPVLPPKKPTREPVHVFYVKYKQTGSGEYGKEGNSGVVFDDPIPALTPAPPLEEEEEDHHRHQEHHAHLEDVTPGPPRQTTTLRAIIHPDSELAHAAHGSEGKLRVTFGGPHDDEGSARPSAHTQHGADDKHDKQDGHEEGESAQQPSLAYPAQPTIRFPEQADSAANAHIKRSQHQPAPHLQQTGFPGPLQGHAPQAGPQQGFGPQPQQHFQQGRFHQPPQDFPPYRQNQFGPPPPPPPPAAGPLRGAPPPQHQKPAYLRPQPSLDSLQNPRYPPYAQQQGPFQEPFRPRIPGPGDKPQRPPFQQPQQPAADTFRPNYFPQQQAPSAAPSRPQPPFVPSAQHPSRPAFQHPPPPPPGAAQPQFPPYAPQPEQQQRPQAHQLLRERHQQQVLLQQQQQQQALLRQQQEQQIRGQQQPQFSAQHGQFNHQQQPQQPQQYSQQHPQPQPPQYSQQLTQPHPQPHPQQHSQQHPSQHAHQHPQQHQPQYTPQQAQPQQQFAPQPSSQQETLAHQQQHQQQYNPQQSQSHQHQQPQPQRETVLGSEIIKSIPQLEEHVLLNRGQGPFGQGQTVSHTLTHSQQQQIPQQQQQQQSYQQQRQQQQQQQQPQQQHQQQHQQQRQQQQHQQQHSVQVLDSDQDGPRVTFSSSTPSYSSDNGFVTPSPQPAFSLTPSSTTASPAPRQPPRPVATTTTTTTEEPPQQPAAPTTEEPKIDLTKKLAELPDEVPDDIREQLISSGILGNADIQILDYDKIGDTSIDSLPQHALENFYANGGGSQAAASEVRPVVVAPPPRAALPPIDAEPSASELDEVVEEAAAPQGSAAQASNVEMKVVRYDPATAEGQQVADQYLKKDAAVLNDPVVLNDNRYNRYLPLKISGATFPLPDAPLLRGRNVTSVVVLAPVDYDFLQDAANAETSEDGRVGRAVEVHGVRFVAGDALKKLVRTPTQENYRLWLQQERLKPLAKQSVILLVTSPTGDSKADAQPDKEIFMYDASSDEVSRLTGELSTSFVEVAESNALSQDLESVDVEGEAGEQDATEPKTAASSRQEVRVAPPEGFLQRRSDVNDDVAGDLEGAGSDPVTALFRTSIAAQEDMPQVAISSGYARTSLS